MFEPINDKEARENIRLWLARSSESEKQAVIELINSSPKKAIDAFYTTLKFGTSGMRGKMGVGTNRINTSTIGLATMSLAVYMKKAHLEKKEFSVMIGYDNRENSRKFAEIAAKVLAGNGVKAYLLKNLRPTPFLSFSIRHKKCDAGCMITASHNPKEYNGFKVYWSDGGQVLPPHDNGIIELFKGIKEVSMADSLVHPLIEEVEEELDEAYIKALMGLQCQNEINSLHGSHLNIVYSSLHGTGSTLLPKLFNKWGFTNVSYVLEQCIPDEHFKTVKSPNPEDIEALKLGIEEMERTGADLFLATDPDADRVGAAVFHKGRTHILSGNQIAALLAEHVFSSIPLKENAACLKSIVTTELFRKIAENYRVACFDFLPGFKHVAEKIRELPAMHFVLAAEQAFGYLYGSHARDKDALIASLLLSESALKAKLEGKTLIDTLYGLYEKYGLFFDAQQTRRFPDTKEGMKSMQRAMEALIKDPPLVLSGREALKKDLLPKAKLVTLEYEGGLSLMIRPSGTEPKIKIYLELQRKIDGSVEETLAIAESESKRIFEELFLYWEAENSLEKNSEVLFDKELRSI